MIYYIITISGLLVGIVAMILVGTLSKGIYKNYPMSDLKNCDDCLGKLAQPYYGRTKKGNFGKITPSICFDLLKVKNCSCNGPCKMCINEKQLDCTSNVDITNDKNIQDFCKQYTQPVTQPATQP